MIASGLRVRPPLASESGWDHLGMGKTTIVDSNVLPMCHNEGYDISHVRGVAADNVVVHDPDYRVALQDFNTFLEKLSEKVIEADGTIPELPVKDIVS